MTWGATHMGTTITLAEEIMLLSLDDESGVVRQRQSVAPALAGAILLELVLAERVSISGKHLELRSTEPTGEPLLDGRIRLIETWMRGLRPAPGGGLADEGLHEGDRPRAGTPR